MSGYVSNEERKFENKLYADIARAYLKSKKVYRYRLKKIRDMDDEEVNQKCHSWYEENKLRDDYMEFQKKMLLERGIKI